MAKSLQLLSHKGRLVFIIPDSFLVIKSQQWLRKNILENYVVEEITRIPSSWFTGLSMGYSNLVIITIVNERPNSESSFIVYKDFIKEKSSKAVSIIKSNPLRDNTSRINQKSLTEAHQFQIKPQSDSKFEYVPLGELADCVTGFCSGSNSDFYLTLDQVIESYNDDEESTIDFYAHERKNILNGLSNSGKKFVPVLKGKSTPFITESKFFAKWSNKQVEFYKSFSKTRFQNSSYYFRTGIGVPMVKSKKVKAFSLDGRLFDQSVVGIFPKQHSNFLFLLGFLNSDLFSELVHDTNHTANNSANYLKLVPIPVHEDLFRELSIITAICLRRMRCNFDQKHNISAIRLINSSVKRNLNLR